MNKPITMANGKESLFFIIGCQRSGTTLTRLILESHSQVQCMDEYRCYEYLKNPKNFDDIKESKYLGLKTPLITEQLEEPFFSDPSLNYIIYNNFKKNPRLFMIRDVRDTTSSMINLQQEDSTWFKIWPTKNLEFWIQTIPDFRKTYESEISLISNSKNQLHSIASFYWKIKTELIFDYEKFENTKRVYYEELVQKPKETIEKMIDFLDIPWEDVLLSHHKVKHADTDEHGITIGNNDTKLPIFTKSIGKYNEKFSKSQIEDIMDISGDLMKKLGYNF